MLLCSRIEPEWQSYSDTIVYSVAAGDIDDNGDIELVTGGLVNNGVCGKAQLKVWNYSNNRLNLEHEEIWDGGCDIEIYSTLISDVDNDGKKEIITAGMSNDRRNDRGEIRIYYLAQQHDVPKEFLRMVRQAYSGGRT